MVGSIGDYRPLLAVVITHRNGPRGAALLTIGDTAMNDTRRTMEEVFRAWLYDEALDFEERARLVMCANEIQLCEQRGWPYHFERDSER